MSDSMLCKVTSVVSMVDEMVYVGGVIRSFHLNELSHPIRLP